MRKKPRPPDGLDIPVASTPAGDETPWVPPEEKTHAIEFSDLVIGQIIGQGGSGTVRRVQHKQTKVNYAIKIISMADSQFRTLKQEDTFIREMERKEAPNVVQAIDTYYIDSSLRILMEYMDVGTLKDVIKAYGPIPSHICAFVTKQVLEGLEFLHTTKVMHRDLKPSNLLANRKGQIKISDFGVSRFLVSNKDVDTMVGTKPYMSPERIVGKAYGTSSDIWSLGLTVAELALGRYPFYSGDIILDVDNCVDNPFSRSCSAFELAATIAERRIDVDLRHYEKLIRKFYPHAKLDITDALCDFVARCLKRDPEQRSRPSDLLKHEFIISNQNVTTKTLADWFSENKIKEAIKITRAERKPKS